MTLPLPITDWTDLPVLVTGAGGFIGSHLAEELARRGARVRAFVRYNSRGSAGWLDETAEVLRRRMTIHAGDVRDADFVRRAAKGTVAIFHLAALIGIPYSYDAPLSYLRTNAEGTLNILEAARAFGVQRIVQVSTSEVYGTARTVPISEDHPQTAQSPYAASKIGADRLAQSYWLSFGTPVVIARPFNTFGPRQSARAVIPAIMAQLLSGERIVRLGNLEPTRDMNPVRNTVEGMIACAEGPEAALGEVFNLGSGHEISIGQLARKIAEAAGVEAKVIRDEERIRPATSEVERLLADSSKAARVLGWTPKRTLEEGLAETVEWMRGHLHIYRPGEYAV
ncbi:MAG: SDR family NAD(P)-dependent oxidoreductase [Sumerlaeia bacterium]